MKTNKNLWLVGLGIAGLFVFNSCENEEEVVDESISPVDFVSTQIPSNNIPNELGADDFKNRGIRLVKFEDNGQVANVISNSRELKRVPADIEFIKEPKELKFPERIRTKMNIDDLSKLSGVGKNFILSNIAAKTGKNVVAVAVGGKTYYKSNSVASSIPFSIKRELEQKEKDFGAWALSDPTITYGPSKVLKNKLKQKGNGYISCNPADSPLSDSFTRTESKTKESNWNVTGGLSVALEGGVMVPFLAESRLTTTITLTAGGGGSKSTTESISYTANLNVPGMSAMLLREFTRDFEAENDFSFWMEFDGYVQYIYNDQGKVGRGQIKVWDALFSERGQKPNRFLVTGTATQSSIGDRLFSRKIFTDQDAKDLCPDLQVQ